MTKKEGWEPKTFWVEALAGAGKTFFLVSHLLQLLFNGQNPERILCLTFTRKAAMHWKDRLYGLLSDLAQDSQEDRYNRLTRVLQRTPCAEEIRRSPDLFNEVKASPPFFGTLHSFCHTLLQSQGLAQEVLDEAEALSLWNQSLSDAQTLWTPHTALGQSALKLWKGGGPFLPQRAMSAPVAPSRFAPDLNPIPVECEQEDLIKKLKACQRFDASYSHQLLTKEGGRRVLRVKNPALLSWVEREQNLAYLHRVSCEQQQHFDQQHLLFSLSQDVDAHYQRRKGARMDFDELILKARDLLDEEATAGSLAHGLDMAWDHVLLDEAQDTNLVQWCIVRHLVEILLINPEKTFCVVGDSKQCIYEFQGARVEAFVAMRWFLQCWVEAHGGIFEIKHLDKSFRSAQSILDLTNGVFEGTHLGGQPFPFHHPVHGHRGQVLFLPAWKTVEEAASFWIDQVEQWIKTPFFLEGQNRWLRPEDILILLPRRNSLFKKLQQALSQLGVLGVRDGLLKESETIKELLTLFQWLVDPYEEDTLADLLRGPFFNISEVHLARFSCVARGNLWEHMQNCWKAESCVQQLKKWQEDKVKFSLLDVFVRILARGKKKALTLKDWHDRHLFLDALVQWPSQNWVGFLEMMAHKKATHLPCIPGVGLMTIHAAKGLESPVVILPDLPEALGQESEDYWRLLYVALTRAQERLYIHHQQGLTGWAQRLQEVGLRNEECGH